MKANMIGIKIIGHVNLNVEKGAILALFFLWIVKFIFLLKALHPMLQKDTK